MPNIRLCKLSLILTMMLLLLPGTPASANTAGDGTIKLLPPGTTLTESSYVVPIQDGRDTLELIDTQSAEIAALQGIVAAKDVQIDKLIAAVEDLNTNRLAERSEWQAQVTRLHEKNSTLEKNLAKEKSKRWAIGPFAGIAHNGEAVIGISVTYALIKF